MKEYSKKILTDDNFDYEHELLCDKIGISHINECEIYTTLPAGFKRQMARGENGENLGFAEYVRSMILPDKGSDFSQALEVGEVAYRFKNCFLSKRFESIL